MSGTPEGGKNLRETMIEKFGSEEAWKDWMRQQGRKGGSAKVPKGFSMKTHEERSAAGVKGGTISRRTGVPHGHHRGDGNE